MIGARCRLHAGRGRSATTAGSATTWRSGPNVVLYDGCVLGDRVDRPRQRRHRRRRLRLPHGPGPARQGAAARQRRDRRRRRDRGLHDHRPRHVRGDADRGGHEDRQPRADRPQLPDRPAQLVRRPGRHRRLGAPPATTWSWPGRSASRTTCRIGDRVMLGAKSGVHSDIPAGQQMLGAPATPVAEQLRILIEPGKAAGDAEGHPRTQEAAAGGRTPDDPRSPIGLLAGWGRFPVLFAEKAKSLGIPVVCVGIRGMADRAALEPLCHRFYWPGWRHWAGRSAASSATASAAGRWPARSTRSRCSRPAAGSRLVPDLRMLRFWFFRRRPNNADDSSSAGSSPSSPATG